MALARAPRTRVLRLLPELALLLFAGSVAAQTPFLPDSSARDPAVPTVAALRGFETGTGFSLYSEVELVLHGLDEASDRVRLESYGSSVEGRRLWLAWISSPANLAALEDIRAANLEALSNGRSRADPARPIIVWLSFGAHGDEASSSEAALEMVYHLASSRDPAVAGWLDDAVVVVDPLLNPDGHERYVAWFRSVVGPVPDPDPEAREHRPPWPGGRTNHWYFDLNRDWAWGVQPETRARIGAYLATMPQVHVDFHEMDPGSTYFFFPAAQPIHGFYPASTGEWGRVFGNANAAAFDREGWPYFTGEDFDLYYPGYGDSWPSFLGATGMTYEQAGGAEAGVVLRRPGDAPLTLADRVARHLRAALTTIATAVENRAARLADFDAFWDADVRRAPGTPAAWAIVGGGPASDALAELLVRQGVRVEALAEASAGLELTPFAGSPIRTALPVGSLLVPADQPLGRYVAALLEPDTTLPDTSLFYDITGWSLPYLYDLEAWRAESMPRARREAWRARPAAARPAGEAGVAFAWAYESPADAIAAGRLAARGVRVRVSDRPFSASGRQFPRGSFVVATGGQPAEAGDVAALERTAIEAGASPVPLASFLSDEGIDLGSGHLRLLRAPRIALASGPGTEPTSVGSAWHLLGVEARLPLDVVRLGDIAAEGGADEDSLAALDRVPLDLSPYTAIVLPDADDPAAYVAALGPEGARRLEAWVRAGGTLVTVRAAAAWLADSTTGIADLALAPATPPPDDERRRAPQREREVEKARSRIPGTLLATVVDTTAVLGYGYADGGATVLVRDPTELELAEEGNAWVFADAGARSGYLPPDARQRLAGRPYAIVRETGKGRVIAFADDPAFRGILYGLKKVYLNAILLF